MSKHLKQRPLFAHNIPKNVKKPKIDWSVLSVVWLAAKRMAMAIGFLFLFQAIVMLLLLPRFLPQGAPSLPAQMVLYIELDDVVAETQQAISIADPFAKPVPSLRDLTRTIKRAALDARVRKLVVRLNDGALFGLTQINELHDALAEFKASGKRTYIYASSYGGGAGGLGRYYFASAFDEIWMQPLGVVSVSGLRAEVPYFRSGLEKLGVEPEFFQRKDYKTAYESMTREGMSDENREMMERLIGDFREDIIGGVAANTGIAPARFGALVDTGILTASEAKAGGLITHSDYADVLVGNLAKDVTGDRDAIDDVFVGFDRYAGRMLPANEFSGAKDSVALIYAVGAIMPSGDNAGPMGAGGIAAADEIAPAILAAADDDNIKAIVLRVDSPGGSPVASESILRALERAQDKGKSVTVSMGATAASGGYWIASYADRIFVLPSTITGSIGVVGGKFSLAGLWEKIGVNWDAVTWGQNAGMMSMNKPFSESEAKRFNVMLDVIYDAFIARVSKGREMSPEAVDAIAGGRVWTGKRALELGLADEIGGLDAALDYAAREVGHDGRSAVNVVVMPRPKTAIEQIVMLLEGQVQLGQFMRNHAGVFEALRPVSDMAAQASAPQDFMLYDPISIR